MRSSPLCLADQCDEGFGLDLSQIGKLLQTFGVGRGRHRTHQQLDPLRFHPTTSVRISIHAWWPLKAEAGHRFELLREVQQLPFLAEASDELNADRQPLVRTGGKPALPPAVKAARQPEREAPPPSSAQET